MKLIDSISIHAGGPGSGRHKINWVIPKQYQSLYDRGFYNIKEIKTKDLKPYEFNKRSKESLDKIKYFQDAIRNGKDIPMIPVYKFISGGHPMEDGHHRRIALIREGVKEIKVLVKN